MNDDSRNLPPYLKDYREHEKEQESIIIDKYGDKLKNCEPFELKNCFPEFDLKPPFTFLPFEMKIYHLLPFYRNLIIDLYPYETEKEFLSEYGATVKDLITIFEEYNNLFFRVEGPLEMYSKLGYLKPIFDLYPPNSDRFERVFSTVNREIYEDVFKKMNAVLLYFKQITPFDPSEGMNTQMEKLGRINTYTNMYCHLFLMHGRSVADDILEYALTPPSPDINPWLFFKETFKTYSKCTIFPKTKSLGGPHLLGRSTYFSARMLHLTPDQMGIQFPFDVDTGFLQPMKLQMPRDLDIALEIDAKRWRNALSSYEDAIKNRQINEIKTRIKAIEIENNEINLTLENMSNRRRQISNPLHMINDGLEILFLLGGFGEITGFPDSQNLLGIAAGLNLIGGKLIDPAADVYIKFQKSDQVCLIYDINRRAK